MAEKSRVAEFLIAGAMIFIIFGGLPIGKTQKAPLPKTKKVTGRAFSMGEVVYTFDDGTVIHRSPTADLTNGPLKLGQVVSENIF